MSTNKSKHLRSFSKNYRHLNLLQNCSDAENDFLNVFSWNPEYLSAGDWNVQTDEEDGDFWGLFPWVQDEYNWWVSSRVWPVQIILHFCDNICT